MVRRKRLCLEFVQKAMKHKKFMNWFNQIINGNPLEKARFADTIARQRRLSMSPIPYFTRLLNKKNGHVAR